MKIVFSTNNIHKLKEAKLIMPNIEIISLADININTDIPEDFETLEENAVQKAKFIENITELNVFSDDTGLEIEALGNKPGVYSARYAGTNCTFKDNVEKVLKEMKGMSNRRACFRTIIALIINKNLHIFEGKVDGIITKTTNGTEGFGYDPIFKPKGYDITFAEMPLKLKNKISHRGIAMEKVKKFIEEIV